MANLLPLGFEVENLVFLTALDSDNWFCKRNGVKPKNLDEIFISNYKKDINIALHIDVVYLENSLSI